MERLITTMKNHCKNTQVHVSNRQSPSYISCFFPNEAPTSILLVYKQDPNESVCSLDIPDVEDFQSFVADVTGTPLDCRFDDVSLINTTAFSRATNVSELPRGLDILNARSLLCLNNMEKNSSTSFWVVCDGEDIRQTLLLCSYRESGRLVSGWAKKYLPINKEPDPRTFLTDHQKMVSNQRCKIDWKIEGVYKSERRLQINNPDYNCKLKVSWSQHLSFYPPTSSNLLNASLVAECTPGRGEGPLRFIWEQILILYQYYTCINSDDQCSITNIPISDYVITRLPHSDARPSARLLNLLKEPIRMKSSNAVKFESLSQGKSLTNLISEISSPEYSELDPLGKLWYLLLECTSLNEVRTCLNQLDSYLSNQHSASHLNQILWVTNINQLISMPLRRVVDFGIEKLKKEMGLIFSRAKLLCNVSELPMLGHLSDNEWKGTVRKPLRWLAKKFCLLEQLVYAQIVFDVPNESLHSLALNLETQLTTMVDDNHDIKWFTNNTLTFNSHALPFTMFKNLSQIIPNEWLMTVTSTENGQCRGKSKFFVSLMQPFLSSNDNYVDECIDAASTTIIDEKLEDETKKLWSSQLHVIYH